MRRRQRWLQTPLRVRFTHSLDVYRGLREDIRGNEGQFADSVILVVFSRLRHTNEKQPPIKDMRATERQIHYRDNLVCNQGILEKPFLLTEFERMVLLCRCNECAS
jgi:hypothetical protein